MMYLFNSTEWCYITFYKFCYKRLGEGYKNGKYDFANTMKKS